VPLRVFPHQTANAARAIRPFPLSFNVENDEELSWQQ
jgi:hypothetical protein